MSNPKIAARVPVVMELDPGEYWWCACGHSDNQPYCDGSHAGTGMGPTQLLTTEKEKVALCQCKHTAKPPMCDGAHKRLPDDVDAG